jgi:trk system potassium uptake protein
MDTAFVTKADKSGEGAKKMIKQYAVIGLGNFGMALARQLSEKGAEVVAIDPDPAQVQLIKDEVTQAVVADATEPQVMATLGVQEMDAALICIRCSISDSLLAVLNLRDLGVSCILAMAINEAHGRLLAKLGVDQILFPERDQASSLTEKLLHPNMIEYLPLVEGYGIIEWQPPPAFLNQPLYELDLINRYGAQVIAVKGSDSHSWQMIPTGQYVTSAGDHLLLLAPHDFLDHVSEEAAPHLFQELWQKPREAVQKLWHKTKSRRQKAQSNNTKASMDPASPSRPPLATPAPQPSFQMAPPQETTPDIAPEGSNKNNNTEQHNHPEERSHPPVKEATHKSKALPERKPSDERVPLWVESKIFSPKDLL